MEADPRPSGAAVKQPPPPPEAPPPGPSARRMPEPVDDAAKRGELEGALRQFHATGDAADLAGADRVTPAALASLADQLEAAPTWPVFLQQKPQGPTVQPLRDVLVAAHAAMQKAGRPGPALTANFAAFQAKALAAVREGQAFSAAKPFFEAVGRLLATDLKLSEGDAKSLAKDLAALAAQMPAGLAFDLTPDAPVRLVLEVVRAHRDALRASFAAQLDLARERLGELVQLDDLAQKGRDAEVLAGALGPAARLLNPAALAQALGGGAKGSEPMPKERRARVQALLAELDQASRPGTELVVVSDAALPDVPGVESHVDGDPVAAATRLFDAAAAEAAALFRLVRKATLEADGRYQPQVHDAALAALDWHGFTADELGAVQPVLAVVPAARLRGRDAVPLSALQRSGRPVMVVALDRPGEPDEAQDLGSYHASLGLVAVAHRETYVVQAGLARPEALARSLGGLARALRPSLAVVAAPTDGAPAMRALRAEAALLGRVLPEFRFDPDAGAGWAQRFELGPDQAPDVKWTVRKLAYQRPGGEASLDVPLTFADAMAFEPAYRRHFCVVPPAAWGDELVPLVDWLEQQDAPARGPAAATRSRALPYVWVVDGAGRLQRAVVTRALALATRDRQRAWRLCQELAGFETLQRAVAEAKAQAEAEARTRIAALEAAHKAQLDEARAGSARESMIRLAAALTNLTPPKPGTSAAKASAAPAAEKAAAPASAAAAAPAAAEAAAPSEEPWIDSALCTSCNDCIKVNKLMFVYNAEKQATIGDLGKGTYAEMIKAAEACPAKCIHPGKPRAGDSTATPDLVARGARLN